MIVKLVTLVILYFVVNYLITFFKSNIIHKKVALYFDYIFIYRPTLFFIIWAVVCLGMYIAYLSNSYNPQWIFEFNFKTCLLFIAITCIMGSIFIINNQQKLDENENLRKDTIKLCFNITLIIGLISLLFINVYNFILGLILCLFGNLIYTKEDIQNSFFLKCFSNTFMGIILLLSGFIIVQAQGSYLSINTIFFSYKSLVLIFLSSLCCLAIFLMIEVFESDYALLNNRRIITAISTLLLLFVLLISLYIQDPLLSICAIVSFPFYLYALLRNQTKDIIRTIRYPIFIFNFFIATIFPYLAIAVIIIFYLSKYYYWHRLNIHYPTFLIEND